MEEQRELEKAWQKKKRPKDVGSSSHFVRFRVGSAVDLPSVLLLASVLLLTFLRHRVGAVVNPPEVLFYLLFFFYLPFAIASALLCMTDVRMGLTVLGSLDEETTGR